MEILKLEHLRKAKILHRPSKKCKTPYVADAYFEESPDVVFQAHCPSLGCCGLCEAGSNVYVTPIQKTGKSGEDKRVCSYVVYLALFEEPEKNHKELIGIHPKLAETIVEKCLEKDMLEKLVTLQFQREVKIMNSRFDFTGTTCHNNPFVLEVKNVPLADYVDCSAKDRKKMNFKDKHFCEKISYFPDGYRKKKNDVVSPRALKHVKELQILSETTMNETYMCYVIQRSDSIVFQTSVMDPIYKAAVNDAVNSGVQIITIGVSWNEDGRCFFERDDYDVRL